MVESECGVVKTRLEVDDGGGALFTHKSTWAATT